MKLQHFFSLCVFRRSTVNLSKAYVYEAKKVRDILVNRGIAEKKRLELSAVYIIQFPVKKIP